MALIFSTFFSQSLWCNCLSCAVNGYYERLLLNYHYIHISHLSLLHTKKAPSSWAFLRSGSGAKHNVLGREENKCAILRYYRGISWYMLPALMLSQTCHKRWWLLSSSREWWSSYFQNGSQAIYSFILKLLSITLWENGGIIWRNSFLAFPREVSIGKVYYL